MATTLTVAEITTDVLDAFKTRVPALRYFGSDMSAERVKYGQQIIAHLPTLPTAYAHSTANGYKDNAQSARGLLTDVPITINQWTDVPIKLLESDVVQDRSQNYLKTINNAGYVLGKTVADFALGKVLAENFSQKTTASIATTSKDTLNLVRVRSNSKKMGTPRYALCSSDFFSALDADSRISSGDYYGQRVGADPFGKLFNLAGITELMEYPDFPTAENLSAFVFDERAIGIATRLPLDSTVLARQLGIPVNYTAEEIQDEQTGLAIVAFSWIDENDHTIYITFSVMYGAVAGAQGLAATPGTLTDYAGHRVVTS